MPAAVAVSLLSVWMLAVGIRALWSRESQ